jgi:hypothetical protein
MVEMAVMETEWNYVGNLNSALRSKILEIESLPFITETLKSVSPQLREN